MELDVSELKKSIQSAIINVQVATGRAATHKEIAQYIEMKYGKRYAGDGTIGRRVKELVEAGLVRRPEIGRFTITKLAPRFERDGGIEMTKLSDLKANEKVASIALEVMELGEIRQTSAGSAVMNMKVTDESGADCTLAVYGSDTAKWKIGDRVELKNGWVKEYNGKLELTAGKYGKIKTFGGLDDLPITHPDFGRNAPEAQQSTLGEFKVSCPCCGASLKLSKI